MKKRDFTTAFENDNHIDTDLSLDEAVHGAAPKLDTGRIIAKPISIFEIYPDPTQPRRAIPSSVRQGWDGSPSGIESILIAWHSAVEEESQQRFDLDMYLDAQSGQDNEEDENHDRSIGPMEMAFRGLVDLAATIYRDGLTNPITIAQMSNQTAITYRLETGERRWLAYHLLRANFPHDEQWTKIHARVVDTSNVWRQAAENGARDNLNAIGKARQFALLLMDLWSNDKESPQRFKPFDAFKNEREFYAQVAEMPVPKGKSETLLGVMGAEHRNANMRYKNLLKLPDEVWQLADDRGWAEGRLRHLTTLSSREAIATAREWVLKEEGLSPIGDTKKDPFVTTERDLVKISHRIKNMSESERIRLAERFEELAQKIRRGEL